MPADLADGLGVELALVEVRRSSYQFGSPTSKALLVHR